MRRLAIAALALALPLGRPAAAAIEAPAAAPAPADRQAIEAIVARQIEAWNRHDMHAFVADMAPDVDWINVVGMHWQGRTVVEHAHAALHRMALFANSHMASGDLQVRALTPDVVVSVQTLRIDGVGPTPGGGKYPADGAILSLVFVRTAAGWRIAHGHNTSVDAHAVANDPASGPAR